jgi:hypothetical protein
MKYLKRFEDNRTYDGVKYILFKIYNSKLEPEFGKIEEDDRSYPSPYYVETLSGHTWTGPDEIIRELTQDEIDEFEIQLTSKKYNL